MLHLPSIYPRIHKIHHEFAAPTGLAAEYAHPVETFFTGVGTVLGPLLFARHLLSVWVFLFLRLWETVDDHSGYDLPWNVTKLIPFWAGSHHHDFHHRTATGQRAGNFASVFTVWDRVFGTDGDYRRYCQQQRDKQSKSS
jgi:sterol desaturase/sphingolipid hydroxylase (fatty acid hydroxylase superfamily)